jgi:hypothetical protein
MTEYTQQWKTANYTDGMGSAPFLPPPPNGFTRAYYFTSADYGMCGVALRRLKVARFADANDPFELLGLRLRNRDIRQAVKDFKKQCNKNTGLLCFSRNWTHPVLWSHYAAKHTGVCLGFNLKSDIVRAVIYEKDRLMPDLGAATDSFVVGDDLKEQLLLTKSDYWIYESELRMIIDLSKASKEGQLHFRPFAADMVLSEVILGERCTLQPDKVRELIRATNPCAVVFRSRTEFGTFRVKVNGWDLRSVAEQLSNIREYCT